jgi:hypothetical protein
MVVIYYTEGGEQEAIALRDRLRKADIPAFVRNGSAFTQANDFERCDAVLAIGCPDVEAAYEVRNVAIREAEAEGRAWAKHVTIIKSIDELIEPEQPAKRTRKAKEGDE